MSDHKLCSLEDIPDPGSAGFDVDFNGQTLRVMVIRQGTNIHIYENSCPHRRLPLDFKEGQFLDAEHKFILCSNHVALFQIEDGVCIEGPCKGASLNKYSASLHGDDVYVTF